MIPKKFSAFILFASLAPAGVLCAQGTPADSGKWPWRFPFSVLLAANFDESTETDTEYYGSSVTSGTGSAGINMIVDSTFSRSFAGNTFTFTRDTTLNVEWSFSDKITITLDSGFDRILSLSCSNGEDYECGHCGDVAGISFSFSNLRFDSMSVIYPGSTLNFVSFSYSNDGWEDIDVNNQPSRLYTTTSSTNVSQIRLGGIFRLDTLTTSASVSYSNKTSRALFQSYPNPFSQSTTISFSPQSSGYADISIVNLLGAEVAHLFSGELAAGEHSFVWSNPTGLPDGTYECLVRMNGQVQTLPMVLIH
jgi:hypothetical protein